MAATGARIATKKPLPSSSRKASAAPMAIVSQTSLSLGLPAMRAEPVGMDRRIGEQRIGQHGARHDVRRHQHHQPGGAGELREAGDLDQDREHQRQHAERAVAAVAHDLEPRAAARAPCGPSPSAVSASPSSCSAPCDQHARADREHGRQPARPGDAADDGEDQPGGEADRGADEGQHRQHVGQRPARRPTMPESLPNDTPVKKLACSLKACSHSSNDEGRWPRSTESLGLVMVGRI